MGLVPCPGLHGDDEIHPVWRRSFALRTERNSPRLDWARWYKDGVTGAGNMESRKVGTLGILIIQSVLSLLSFHLATSPPFAEVTWRAESSALALAPPVSPRTSPCTELHTVIQPQDDRLGLCPPQPPGCFFVKASWRKYFMSLFNQTIARIDSL